MEKGTYPAIEDFLLDDAFVAMAKRNCPEEIQAFTKHFPGREQIVCDAVVLVRTLRIRETNCPAPGLAEVDYGRLLRSVRHRRQAKWAVRAVAACIAVGLFLVSEEERPDADAHKNALLSRLDSVNVRTGEVQLIAGESQFQVEDRDVVLQTENSVMVGGKTIDETGMEQTEYLQLVVPYGKRATLKLSDGKMAWINSGATVIYPRRFTNRRELFIDGEVYLEVEKDATRPFIVHTKKFDVAVSGTKFNVHSFDNEAEASVVLVEGAVEVITEKHKNKLSPNEGIFYDRHTIEIKEVDTYSYICWKDGFIQLEGETLDVIFGKLTRYYKVEFTYDPVTADEMYAGKLDLSDSIETILHNLSLSTPFAFAREGDSIRLESIK